MTETNALEVAQALRYCASGNDKCSECPFAPLDECGQRLKLTAANLIEQLKTDNKLLSQNADEAFQEGLNENQALFEKSFIEKFAEKLKEEQEFFVNDTGDFVGFVSVNRIDNLVEETVSQNATVIPEEKPTQGIGFGKPPANIGDTVYSILQEDDGVIKTFEIFPWKVCGFAFMKGKWFLTDFDSELLEVGKDVFVSFEEASAELEKLK